eukprot:5703353-Amphidinium_carterae.1
MDDMRPTGHYCRRRYSRLRCQCRRCNPPRREPWQTMNSGPCSQTGVNRHAEKELYNGFTAVVGCCCCVCQLLL